MAVQLFCYLQNLRLILNWINLQNPGRHAPAKTCKTPRACGRFNCGTQAAGSSPGRLRPGRRAYLQPVIVLALLGPCSRRARASDPRLVSLTRPRNPDGFGIKGTVSKVEGDFSCTLEVQRAIPILKKAYGDSMHKVLHVGPDTCSVVSSLLGEEETGAWGVEPYDIEDANRHCKNLVQRGLVRVADIKFPLPYRAKSFSLVIASDTLEYLSPRYLNKTLPELARVSSDGLVIFTGYPHSQKMKTVDNIKPRRSVKLRSATWWVQIVRYFVQTSLEENEAAVKKFDQAAEKAFYKPGCQIFHLKSYN